jgi:broad specificity phosphatase PhoE
MRILFARHGESVANTEHVFSNQQVPHPLTELGKSQARSLADKLKSVQVNVIISSPVIRAMETTQIVCDLMGMMFSVDEALREFGMGELEGRSDSAAWDMFSDLLSAWFDHGLLEEKITGGESFVDIKKRFLPFLDGLVSRFGDTDATILLISHGGLYLTMLPLILVNVTGEFARNHMLGNTEMVVAELNGKELNCVNWGGIPITD